MSDAAMRAIRADGVPGLRQLVDRIKARCKKSLFGASYVGAVDHFGAIEAISRGDCSFHSDALKRAKESKAPNAIDSMKKLGEGACL